MATLNVFRQDAFSAISLTAVVDRVPYLPTGIGDLGLFEPLPIRTTALAVEERNQRLTVIPTSPRGAPPTERVMEKRKARYFDVPRLAHGDTIQSSEIQDIRQFGQETELMQVQTEVARRLVGPTGLTSNMEYTWELHRLGAVQGKLLDSDGSVLFDWFDQFGITAPAVIDFGAALTVTAKTQGDLRVLCNQVVRSMMRSSQGAWTPATTVAALVGDNFWDAFMKHPDFYATFLNWQAAQDLRRGTAFSNMDFGGITWINYRGSNDNATIAIDPDEALFFPVGAPGVFQVAWAPAEPFEFANQPGRPIVVLPIIDRDRNMWWRQEIYSYPLHICTRPEVLRKGSIAP